MAVRAARNALEVEELMNSTTASSVSYSWASFEQPAAEIGVEEGRLYFARATPDQSWFWTDAWQKKEKEADEDLREGRYRTFETMDDFITFLHSKNE